MTDNEQHLARMRALHTIEKARLAHLPDPVTGVMDALKEAIDDRALLLARLASERQVDSAEYARVKDQLRRWDAAWRRNR